jgi:aspartyl/asparaginyl beta-hydroxylase (cupin superfamily)
MINQLEFGIQTNGIKHTHLDPMPEIDTRFSMVKEENLFDYVDKTPDLNEITPFWKQAKNIKFL